MSKLTPLNLNKWIEEHRHLLKPPVGNKLVWEDAEFTVMVVGGPNLRKDYHVDPGEEFFYQIEGTMTVRIMEEGGPRDIPIKEGEIFLLPPLIPHSPQRPEGTVGLVVERQRLPHEKDHLRWYCESCGEIVHDVSFHCTNLGTQLKPVIEEFMADEKLRTCGSCGTVMQVAG